MVIFHSYVSLPEGKLCGQTLQIVGRFSDHLRSSKPLKISAVPVGTLSSCSGVTLATRGHKLHCAGPLVQEGGVGGFWYSHWIFVDEGKSEQTVLLKAFLQMYHIGTLIHLYVYIYIIYFYVYSIYFWMHLWLTKNVQELTQLAWSCVNIKKHPHCLPACFPIFPCILHHMLWDYPLVN